MTTQVLVIHGQLAGAVKLKQALERVGAFEVHPFTAVDAAVEYLRNNLQDVVLLHLPTLSEPPEAILETLRAAQTNVVVITIPAQSEADARQLGIQASVDASIKPRDLAAVIENLFVRHQRPSSITSPKSKNITRVLDESSAKPAPPHNLPEHTSLDDVLASAGDIFNEAYADTPVEFDAELDGLGQPSSAPNAEFDQVLNALPPTFDEDEDDNSPENDEFSRLVNSMKESRSRSSLPERQRGLIDFVIRGDSEPSNFDRLAEQEPPMPTFEENGTISQLFSIAQDRSFQRVLSILSGDEPKEDSDESQPEVEFDEPPTWDHDHVPPASPAPVVNPAANDYDFDADPPPVKLILQQTSERGSTSGGFALEELIASIEKQLPAHRPRIMPLPSWIQENQLQSSLLGRAHPSTVPDPDSEDVPEAWLADQTTMPNRGQVIARDSEVFNQETEWLDVPADPRGDTAPVEPPETLPEAIPEISAPPQQAQRIPEPPRDLPETEGWGDAFTTGDFDTQFQVMAAFEIERETGEMEVTGALYTESVPTTPYLMQLATSLTEIALETTAEAILLVREGEIVGYAGAMPREEADDLREMLEDDWSAPPEQARIRFVTAPNSGRDYMIYSRATVEDLTLSLIFAGTTSLRDIRRQGKRLEEALVQVPDTPSVTVPIEEAPALPEVIEDEPILRTAFAFVWLLSDPTAQLEPAVAQAIISGLRLQLEERLWQLHELHVDEDFVYVLADVPGEDPPFHVVRDLKRRSAEIAHAQNAAIPVDSLWSDSYLVVMPGRPLDLEEIQQFISFERM